MALSCGARAANGRTQARALTRTRSDQECVGQERAGKQAPASNANVVDRRTLNTNPMRRSDAASLC